MPLVKYLVCVSKVANSDFGRPIGGRPMGFMIQPLTIQFPRSFRKGTQSRLQLLDTVSGFNAAR